MERLNFFKPYQSLKPWHEDQLTRAFLVVLRFVPLAHSAFLDLIREQQSDAPNSVAIPSFSVLTESETSIETQATKIREVEARLLSILLTDENWNPKTRIESSDRGARYDGVLTYKTGWILVIENKPRHSMTGMWKEQLCPNLPEDTEIVIEPEPVVVPWRDLVSRLSSLANNEILVGSEKIMLNDFLAFVDSEFSYLNPFDKYSRCKDDLYLMQRRSRMLLEEIASDQVGHHKGLEHCIKLDSGPVREIYLRPEERRSTWNIQLKMYPGDTISQARELYDQLDVTQIRKLVDNGWSCQPNMHFTFMGTGLVWSQPDLSTQQYIEFWRTRQRSIQQEKRDLDGGFHGLFSSLREQHLITQSDLGELEENFQNTERGFINICPGLELTFGWNKELACELDDRGKFGEALENKIKEALRTWQQVMQPAN